MLLDIWGRGAMSLGTTAVERAWWPDHVRNMNRTARWATSAWREVCPGRCLHLDLELAEDEGLP